ncbi:DNA repair protein RadA [Patescibacteria group bacterium]
MARATSLYVCQQCGDEETKWHGKCPNCGSWGSLVETAVSTKGRIHLRTGGRSRTKSTIAKTVSLGSISSGKLKRTTTKIPELDRVLGGGIVPGQVALIAGEPGIGKSTILLQLSEKLGDVLYVSGEESVNQIKIRANRLGIKKKSINLLEETDIDVILETASNLKGRTFKSMIIDSIQTMQTSDLSGMSGSVGQVRECSSRLVKFAKSTGVPVFVVGHVTKTGSVAGPSVLMHIVDTVLWFEGSGDFQFRLLRARKNRFGPTDEVGIFTMEEKGLISMTDTTDVFLSDERNSIPGQVVGVVMEGTRPILVEIQSLIVPTKLAFARRTAQGIDSKRLELLLAVLQRRAGIDLSGHDVFVNVVGGIKVKDPGIDLAVCMSLASVYHDKSLSKSTVAVGEVGLMGEIRDVVAQPKRLTEARRLGYRTTIYSRSGKYVNQVVHKYFK